MGTRAALETAVARYDAGLLQHSHKRRAVGRKAAIILVLYSDDNSSARVHGGMSNGAFWRTALIGPSNPLLLPAASAKKVYEQLDHLSLDVLRHFEVSFS